VGSDPLHLDILTLTMKSPSFHSHNLKGFSPPVDTSAGHEQMDGDVRLDEDSFQVMLLPFKESDDGDLFLSG